MFIFIINVFVKNLSTHFFKVPPLQDMDLTQVETKEEERKPQWIEPIQRKGVVVVIFRLSSRFLYSRRTQAEVSTRWPRDQSPSPLFTLDP